MLKIRTQLDRALRYQAVLGSDRRVGHFDDSAKDLAGPPGTGARGPRKQSKAADRIGLSADKLRSRWDPNTETWVGYYTNDVHE